MSDRIADYAVTHEALLEILAAMDGRTRLRLCGLPSAARVLSVREDAERRCLVFRVESPDHRPAAPGEVVERREWSVERSWDHFPEAEYDAAVPEGVQERDDASHDWAYGNTDAMQAFWDRRFLIQQCRRLVRALGDRDAEVASLRAVFSDYVQDSVVAREAYAQGWRDCQRQEEMANQPTARAYGVTPDAGDWQANYASGAASLQTFAQALGLPNPMLTDDQLEDKT